MPTDLLTMPISEEMQCPYYRACRGRRKRCSNRLNCKMERKVCPYYRACRGIPKKTLLKQTKLIVVLLYICSVFEQGGIVFKIYGIFVLY